jgi:hypothetical protein
MVSQFQQSENGYLLDIVGANYCFSFLSSMECGSRDLSVHSRQELSGKVKKLFNKREHLHWHVNI